MSQCQVFFCSMSGTHRIKEGVARFHVCHEHYELADPIVRLGGSVAWIMGHRMIVMPSNNGGVEVGRLAGMYPGRIEWLITPGSWKRPPGWMTVALDNGAFGAWLAEKEWDPEPWLELLTVACQHCSPKWAVVPDKVTDREATLERWEQWKGAVKDRGIPAAFAVQDGMAVEDVPGDADIVFVGGTTEWKWRSLRMWTAAFDRVHVARVNTERLLWMAHDAGAESCDGTGWFRGDQKQLSGLRRYLYESVAGRSQLELDL